jgi:CRP-like cAMP-binding protein
MESLDNYIQAMNRLLREGAINSMPSPLPVKTGEIVFHAQDPAEKIFGIQSGEIQLVRYLETGQMINQYTVEPGGWFGERALFHGVYANCAIATQPSQLMAVPKHTFLSLLSHDPEIALGFMGQLTEQLHITKTIMTVRCIRSASERVLAYLHTLKTPGQTTCVLHSPIKAIAEKICLTPEVVSRALRKLQDDGIIQRSQRKITFL